MGDPRNVALISAMKDKDLLLKGNAKIVMTTSVSKWSTA